MLAEPRIDVDEDSMIANWDTTVIMDVTFRFLKQLVFASVHVDNNISNWFF
jgi:hypothetical protein